LRPIKKCYAYDNFCDMPIKYSMYNVKDATLFTQLYARVNNVTLIRKTLTYFH